MKIVVHFLEVMIMGQGKNRQTYSEQYFLDKGFVKQPDGSYAPPKFKNPLTQLTPDKIDYKRKLVELTPSTELTHEFSINKPLESVLVIDGLIAGLNGNKGLMRSHWSNSKKQKDFYKSVIMDQCRQGKIRKHLDKVTIQYIGYKSVLMDWDNFASSFKHIGDALVESGIIKDDKPTIVTKFIPQQIKCKRIEQKVVIIIKDEK